MWTAAYFLTGAICFLSLTSVVLAQCRAGQRFVLKVDSVKRSFVSPNYPEKYPSDMTCLWFLETTSKYFRVKLYTEEALNLEIAKGCPYDYIQLTNGSRPREDATRKCIGNVTEISKGRFLTVVFKSDAQGETSSFRLFYIAVPIDGYVRTTVGHVDESGSGSGSGGDGAVKTEILAGGIAGGVVLIIIIGVVCGRCMSSGGPRQPPEHRPAAFYNSHAPGGPPGDTSSISAAVMVHNNNSVFMVSQAMGRNMNPPRYASQINAGMTNMGFDAGGDDGARLAAAGFLGPPVSGEPPPSYCASMLVTNPPSIPTTPRHTTSVSSAEGSGVSPSHLPAPRDSAANSDDPEQQADAGVVPEQSDQPEVSEESAVAGPSASDETTPILEKTVNTGTSAPAPDKPKASTPQAGMHKEGEELQSGFEISSNMDCDSSSSGATGSTVVKSPSLTLSDPESAIPEESNQDVPSGLAQVLEPEIVHGNPADNTSSEGPEQSLSAPGGHPTSTVSEPGSSDRTEVDADLELVDDTRQAVEGRQAQASEEPAPERDTSAVVVSGSGSNSPATNTEMQTSDTAKSTTNSVTNNPHTQTYSLHSEAPTIDTESQLSENEVSAPPHTDSSNTSTITNIDNPALDTKNTICDTETQSCNAEPTPTRTETPATDSQTQDPNNDNPDPKTENSANDTDNEITNTDETTTPATNPLSVTENATDSIRHDDAGSVAHKSSDPNTPTDSENTAQNTAERDSNTNSAVADVETPKPSTDIPGSAPTTADNAPAENENATSGAATPVTKLDASDSKDDESMTPLPSDDYDTDDVFSPSSPRPPDSPPGRLMPKPGCGSLSDVSVSSELSGGSQRNLHQSADRMDSLSSLPPPPSPHPSAGGDLEDGNFPTPPVFDSDGDCHTPRHVDSPVTSLPPDAESPVTSLPPDVDSPGSGL